MKALLLIVLISQIGGTLSAKVLIVTALSTGSEENFFRPIIEGLVNRGHEVTSVTSKKSSSLPPNVIQLEPVNNKEIYLDMNPFAMREQNEDLALLLLDVDYFIGFCKKVFENKEFQEKVVNQKFDIILVNAFLHQCFYGLVPKNNASLIALSSFPMPNFLLHGLGTYFPNFLPYPTLPYADNMSFSEKIYNFLADITLQIFQEISYLDKYEQAYRKYLPGGETLPGIREIQRNISLVIMNTFFVFNFHRPLLPDVIEAGGLHCKPGKPLETDLENFVSTSEAPEGFIYFSLGTMVKEKMIPIKTRNVFIKVFSKLKQRVLWKWDETGGELPGISPNVKISNWLPQNDILGHPNIRMFISHGGLFSTQESVYNGVPIIGAPVYFDQFANIKQAVKQGFGLEIDIYDLKEDQLEWAITQMLTNKTYKERATLMSRVFRDQQQNPLDRALFWIEYVIRHKGAPHLRSGARDLYWFQYHSLDVFLFLTVTIVTILFTVFKIAHSISKCCFSSTNQVDRERKRK